MSKNENVPAMYNRIPTVAALNRVPGFDPMKLLRRMVSTRTGEEVFRLDLQYKKLWFRLAHPEGRIKLKPLRITEQIAIYEALVYLSREDLEPVSNFTASILRTDAPNGQYVQAAQEEAVDKALTDAGFGIQLSDISVPESKRHFGCEVPVTAVNGDTSQMAQQKQSAVQKTAAKDVPRVNTQEKAVSKPAKKETAVKKADPPALQKSVEEKKSVPETKIAEQPMEKPSAATVSQSSVNEEKSGANQALEILRRRDDEDTQSTQEKQPALEIHTPSYTKDLPVEQIIQMMTLEEAKKVVVDAGTCRGKTMEEVAARRIASVKFYLTAGYTSDNNIVRAAARIVLENLELQKAG